MTIYKNVGSRGKMCDICGWQDLVIANQILSCMNIVIYEYLRYLAIKRSGSRNTTIPITRRGSL